MKTPLRTKTHQTIAYITVDQRGVHTITNDRHQVLGYYDPHTNRTKDRHHRTLGYGYQLPRLIPGAISEEGAGIVKPEAPMTPAQAHKEADRKQKVQKRIQDTARRLRDLRAEL